MSLQISVTEHKCKTCGHTWTHSTIHSLTGNWVPSDEPHYTTDTLSLITIGAPLIDLFCYRCALTSGAKVYDRRTTLPSRQVEPQYQGKSLDDLLE